MTPSAFAAAYKALQKTDPRAAELVRQLVERLAYSQTKAKG